MICLLPHGAFLSETSRMIAIYEALLDLGAKACIATHGGTHEAFLREAGIDYHLLEPRMSPERCAQLVTDACALDPHGHLYSDDELGSMVVSEAAFFRDREVKVAVTGFTLTALLSTRVAGIPLVGSYAGSFVPPVVERGMIPPPSHPLPLPLRLLPQDLLLRLISWITPRMKTFSRDFDRIAKELGVAGFPGFLSLFVADLTLVTEVPEILGITREDLESWTPRRPESYRPNPRLCYVGPIFAKLNRAIPPRVQTFISAQRPGRPLVYVAMTSSGIEVVRGVVEALQPIGARLLIAATVHALTDLEGPDLLVEDFLPSHLVMPHVDLAVTTGGQGSVQTAMASGTPLLGIPLQPEQNWNLHLIERQGAGKIVPLHQACTPRMTAMAREALGDANMRALAKRIQSIYANVDGPREAAKAILRLVDSGL